MATETSNPATLAASAAGDDTMRRARRRVIARAVYLAVLVSWAALSVALVAIWFMTTPGGYFWPVWPIVNFVVAALVWGLAVYQRFPFRVSERRVREEIARLRAE